MANYKDSWIKNLVNAVKDSKAKKDEKIRKENEEIDKKNAIPKSSEVPAGIPSNVPMPQSTKIADASTPWYEKPDVDKKIDEYVKKERRNERLSGAQGTIAQGNQGDNKLLNPDAPDTVDVTKKHLEEQAQLQKALGTGEPVSGTIVSTPSLGEEAVASETAVPSESSVPASSENGLQKAPEEANLDFGEYINNYYGPKNGADYLKALWAQGAGGKAKAVGNVLGNILGAVGGGLSGKGYTSDWETFRNNYLKETAERNQKAFDQNLDIARQLRSNEVARNELVKVLDNYAKIGKNIDPEKFEAIRKALTASGNSSQLEYYLASGLGELAKDPAFMESLKAAGKDTAELLTNLIGVTGLVPGVLNKGINFLKQ